MARAIRSSSNAASHAERHAKKVRDAHKKKSGGAKHPGPRPSPANAVDWSKPTR